MANNLMGHAENLRSGGIEALADHDSSLGPGSNCTHCGVWKPMDEYYPRQRQGGLYNRIRRCKPCHVATRTRSSAADLRRNNLKRKYGITPEDVERMLQAQGRECAFNGCSRFPTDTDHDHENGHVRGLLCNQHNTAIGKLGDNLEGVLVALEYFWNQRNRDDLLLQMTEQEAYQQSLQQAAQGPQQQNGQQ